MDLAFVRAAFSPVISETLDRSDGIYDRETGGTTGVPEATRQVWLAGGWRDTPIYRRGQLPPGAALAGPAIVEQLDTTIVVEPGDRVTVDALGNLMIEVGTP